MNKKSYVFMLTNTDRKRHELIKEKGKIIGFVVQCIFRQHSAGDSDLIRHPIPDIRHPIPDIRQVIPEHSAPPR